MGTVPNPWLESEESDERAAETVVFGRGKSDRIADAAYPGIFTVSRPRGRQFHQSLASGGHYRYWGDTRDNTSTLETLRATLGLLGRH